ncbi:MAG: helix-hairpin-helix domain-containing protein, partial [Brevefilum sp.]|nr:helix-hairpin-helix domain-containing protein [Brevefilum sp.]
SAIEDGAKRLLLPTISRDTRRDINKKAEEHAIQVFAKNLRALLTQPPISDRTILGIDPGFRTGSKVVVIDPNGKFLAADTIYPHPPHNKLEQAYSVLLTLIKQFKVSLIVIGNGTASRETEQLIAEITKQEKSLHYLITNEAGASVYSASSVARKEFPDLDVSMRGAVSIARRVQDPLAELVKIDPRSVGVGLYQHDLNQSKLSDALDQVVESVVNSVGVEINTASAELLSHVAGIGPTLAEKIVSFREENGPFLNRQALLKISGLGPKTFEQAAGFLRIRNSDNTLDATAIHPESYKLAYRIIDQFGLSDEITMEEKVKRINAIKTSKDLDTLARSLNSGLVTLTDILDELSHPGRDPRENLPKPILRSDVLSMDDLSPGMQLKGTIRNVVDFGAFVDIGVKIDGLLHRSKIHANVSLKVGDIVEVIIVSIEEERNRIALSMKENSDK